MQSRNTENKISLNKATTQKEHFLQILEIIHFCNCSTENKMDYFHKDDNLPGTHRRSEFFFMLTYIYSKYSIVCIAYLNRYMLS